jgi:predicted DNA-binding protein YlxM (UPF0122 family)
MTISRRQVGQKRERNASVVHQFLTSDKTIAAIAKLHEITRQRAQQIIKVAGHIQLDGFHYKLVEDKKKIDRLIQDRIRNQKFYARYGCSYHALQYCKEKYGKNILQIFKSQKRNWKTAKIKVNILFADWMELWILSNKWNQRGRGHCYGMSVIDKTKPAQVGNLKIIIFSETPKPRKKKDGST